VSSRGWPPAAAGPPRCGQVCCGARVFDDEGGAMYGTVSGRPAIHLLPWDEEAVLEQNLTDMTVMAHRRCELRFDEELPYTVTGTSSSSSRRTPARWSFPRSPPTTARTWRIASARRSSARRCAANTSEYARR
jgi:hypothetical protein